MICFYSLYAPTIISKNTFVVKSQFTYALLIVILKYKVHYNLYFLNLNQCAIFRDTACLIQCYMILTPFLALHDLTKNHSIYSFLYILS